MWFGKSAYVHGEDGRNCIENREENIRGTKISLTTLNGGNLIFS